MFVGNGRPRKPEKRAEARRLRTELGLPYKQIAHRLSVSPHSVHNWTRDISISDEQRRRNLAHMTPQSEVVMKRAATWRAVNRARRLGYQMEGRARAKMGDPLHQAGCMLYWAEGSKSRNCVVLANSDPHMVRFFREFVSTCFEIQPDRFYFRLNVYLDNGLSITEVEDHWCATLALPRVCIRKHSINHFPTSSSGRKKNRLPFGVCTLGLNETRLVQHIYGAIQEYANFEEPRWLDGPTYGSRRPATANLPP